MARPSIDCGSADEGNEAARLLNRRAAPILELAERAQEVAATCHAMALRFHQGGKLIVFGVGAASTDAMHVAVEFMHPVIVGKRALPAIALTSDVATITGVAAGDGMASIFAHQIRVLGEPADIAMGISASETCPSVLHGLIAAHERGMLTIALTGGESGEIAASPPVDHVLAARCADPRIVKEVHVTTYHLLWELVHVFFEQPGAAGLEVTA